MHLATVGRPDPIVVGAVALAESPAVQAAIEGGEEELVALSERYGPEVAAEAQSAFEATARSLRSIDLGRIGERALGVFNQVKERMHPQQKQQISEFLICLTKRIRCSRTQKM
jgi:hypothetical protein